MQITKSKLVIAVVLVLAAVGLLFYYLYPKKAPPVPVPVETKKVITQVIGKSVEGRNIMAYTYGDGPRKFIFVGAIHGGYEWNSALLAFQAKDYLDAHPEFVPSDSSITIIPELNVDAVTKVTGKEGPFVAQDVTVLKEQSGQYRFNAHNVDINRNFDCKWQPESTWQNKKVSAGSAAFSEPEAVALRDFVLKEKPTAVVLWHSQAGAVYASQCQTATATSTLDLMNLYAKAGNYPAISVFDAYPVTGAAEDWLASIGIPAITVELKTHESVEWPENLAAMQAVLNSYGK